MRSDVHDFTLLNPPLSLSARAMYWSFAVGDVIGSAVLAVGKGVLRSTHCVTCHRFLSVSKTG